MVIRVGDLGKERGGAGEGGMILKGQHEKTSNELLCILSVLVVT